MDEKTPRTRTFSFSLCGTIIPKTKVDAKNSAKTMKPSHKVREALSRIGLPTKDSKAPLEQKESGASHSPKQYPVEAVLHGYVLSNFILPT